MTSTDGLAGVSPGGNLDPVGLTTNLSLGTPAITPGIACFEVFSTGQGDLAGYQVAFVLDSSGNPIAQL
jgi:hypothetical protein